MAIPKIIYPTGGGTTLTFDYAPRNLPFAERASTRHDNLSSSGIRETVFERTDVFLSLFIEYAKVANMAAWDSFIQSAEQGIPFDYYPDATSGTHTVYLLESTDWTADYKSLGMYTFKIKFRRRVGWP